MEAFPLDVVEMSGYRVGYATTPSNYLDFTLSSAKAGGSVTARDSLGLTFASDGKITGVVPDMIGDKKGLSTDMQVVAVNSRKFSADALTSALEDGVKSKKLELLILQGEAYKTVTLDYAGGPKYLELSRDEDKPDVLADILKPRLAKKKK